MTEIPKMAVSLKVGCLPYAVGNWQVAVHTHDQWWKKMDIVRMMMMNL